MNGNAHIARRLSNAAVTYFFLAALVVGMTMMLAAPANAAVWLTDAVAVIEPGHRADPAPAAPMPIRLPFNWDTTQGSVNGTARLTLTFAANDLKVPHALFTRIGSTFTVTLNGEQIAAMGEPGNPYQDFGKEPQFIRIPAILLRETNTLNITLHALKQRNAGVIPVLVGPADEVYEEFKKIYRLRISAALAIAIVSLSLGLLALLLWFRQRDQVYLFYGIGELLWALQISDTLLNTSPLPWPWWGIFVFSAYMMAAGFICKFSLAMLDLHAGAVKKATSWHLLATIPVLAADLFLDQPILWKAWQGITVLVCLWTAYLVIRHGIRAPALEKRVLAVAAAATAAAALRDFVALKLTPGVFGGLPWVRYAWVIYAMTLVWVIAERLRKSTESMAKMTQTLASSLTAREAELNALFARQAASERQQAATEERQRLTRDMHDGIGSQLAGALLIAQDSHSSRALLVEHLRETLDHLKLTVDAMQESDGDVATILGALRYRLAPRLEACGIALTWQVQSLPALSGWSVQQVRHLQLLLFEAFSNLMTHAQATQAELNASCENLPEGRAIRIVLSDNGRGFSVDANCSDGGHGLTNMRSRAASLGATLQISSSSAGTVVDIRLPLPA